jgi:hypothetical protein
LLHGDAAAAAAKSSSEGAMKHTPLNRRGCSDFRSCEFLRNWGYKMEFLLHQVRPEASDNSSKKATSS